MRLIFAGTPEVAVPSLSALLASDHEVVAVLTRADAPTGRGRRLRPSPVKQAALDAGIDVLEPTTLRDSEVQDRLRAYGADAVIVVAYGLLVPAEALAIPALGWFNLHFSLLPHLRGAAPVQRAVLAGEERTGLTVFRIDEGLDTGPILVQESSPIGPLETAGDVLDRFAAEGAPLLVRACDQLARGAATLSPQGDAGVSHAAKLTPAEARIDFDRPRAEVSDLIRGMSPQPGAWTMLGGERFKILGIESAEAPEGTALAPGRILATKKHVFAGTADAPIALGTVAPPGKRPMRAADWARGANLPPDAAFAGPDTTSTEKENR